MSEIKVKPKSTIKKLDKNIVQVQKFKNNLVTTKEKINQYTINENNNTAEDYASQVIQNDISYLTRKGAIKTNEIGKKSLQETQQNFIKGKEKVEILKSKIKQKNIIDKSTKTIKTGTKNSIKNSKKTKLSFTDSSIILTMQESNITDLVSFDQQFKNFNEINLIGLDYL